MCGGFSLNDADILQAQVTRLANDVDAIVGATSALASSIVCYGDSVFPAVSCIDGSLAFVNGDIKPAGWEIDETLRAQLSFSPQ